MSEAETLQFDAEVEKIFHLVIHSLYQNKDIFLRELISNSSDACDKLRYKAVTEPELIKDDPEFKITISCDKKNRTMTISDNGIGMTRAELIKNLGTIAHSGTQNFLQKLTGDNKKDTQLIGQFGVGFYSSFMVAEKVRVLSRAAGKKNAHIWESEGQNKYTVAEYEGEVKRGTSITLYIRREDEEYLDKFRIKHVVKTYSNHIPFKILFIDENGNEEVINEGKAIWLKNKSEVTEDEYKEFYRSVSHLGQDEPWLTLHGKAEGTLQYSYLLYVPSVRPFDLYNPDRKTQVKLYVKRVFIAENGIEIIPPYLRFLRGVVDSEDLSLNISRETVQNNAIIRKIRKALTKKVLGELANKAEVDKEAFVRFWDIFGPVLKEGLCDGLEPRDEIIEACRFRSTKSGQDIISLKQYIDRMQKDQKSVYYIAGDEKSIMNSPHLEGFRKRDVEVLLLTDSVDQFWVNVLNEYKGVPLKSVTRRDSEFEDKNEGDENKKKENEKPISELINKLTGFMKDILGESVRDVRVTNKLAESPVCLAAPEGGMDIRMERFLVENKQLPFVSAKILEINPSHKIIIRLAEDVEKQANLEQVKNTIHLLFAQATIIEGEPVEDIQGFSRRMNELLEKVI